MYTVGEQVQDQDTVESLALANSASDTADSKRRVFLGALPSHMILVIYGYTIKNCMCAKPQKKQENTQREILQ